MSLCATAVTGIPSAIRIWVARCTVEWAWESTMTASPSPIKTGRAARCPRVVVGGTTTWA